MESIDQPKGGRARRQTERLLNLLIALRSASGWMDRDTLRQSISDYRDKDSASFDKMFSRDKALLRNLGIEISTTDWSDPFTGESAYGYRIGDEGFRLPPIDLSAQEIALLAAGVDVMRSTAVSGSAATAVNKLRGQSIASDIALDRDTSIDVTALDDRYAEVMKFVTDRLPMRFRYRKPGSGPETRTIVGYCLLTRGKKTYVVGYDLDKQAQRAFRLSRMLGRVSAADESRKNEVPAGFTVDPTLVGELGPEKADLQEARLLLTEGKGLPLRRRGMESPNGVVTVPFSDLHAFAAELLTYGDSVTVIGPPDLSDAHLDLARATLKRLQALQGVQ